MGNRLCGFKVHARPRVQPSPHPFVNQNVKLLFHSEHAAMITVDRTSQLSKPHLNACFCNVRVALVMVFLHSNGTPKIVLLVLLEQGIQRILCCCCYCGRSCCVVQAGLELAMQFRTASNFQSSCLGLMSAGITGMCLHQVFLYLELPNISPCPSIGHFRHKIYSVGQHKWILKSVCLFVAGLFYLAQCPHGCG